MTTIFEALRTDHEIQRDLVDRLVETHGDTDERAELFDALKEQLEGHAAAEERHFYVPLMEYDQTQEKARHSVAEHKELDDYVEELEETEPSSPAWLATAKTLRERLHHHLDEEEQEVFQQAGKVLADDEKTSLADEYRSMMDESVSEGAGVG